VVIIKILNIMNQFYKNILLSVEKEEIEVSRSKKSVIDEAYHMVLFLDRTLSELKVRMISTGFESIMEEIFFFKNIKPQILGKLIFYNKIVRIESFSPTNADLIETYYTEQIKILNIEYKKHIVNSDFYSYYRTRRTDKDEYFFRLGNINYFDGLNSFFFEVDREFSTFYDFKIARILAFDLLYNYLDCRIDPEKTSPIYDPEIASKKQFSWTHSKNALIELIYALHVSGSLSHGRGSLKKLGILFEELFEIKLGDIHHAFHQMKFRAGEKASYLNFLKNSLEQYMDKDL
jgi:hypothetical protein